MTETALARSLAALREQSFASRLGLAPAAACAGRAGVALPYDDAITNRGGTVHGGALAAAALAASKLAAMSSERDAEDRFAHPADLSMSFLSAVRGESVVADASVLHRGRDVAHVAIELRTDAGRPVARALATECFGGAATPVAGFRGPAAADAGPDTPYRPGGSQFLRAAGIRVFESADEWGRAWLPVDPNAAEPGVIADGALATLADSCGAYASYAGGGVPFESPSATLSLSLVFAARPAGPVVGAGRLVSRAGDTFMNHVEIFAAQSRSIVALGSVTYRIRTAAA